MPTTIFWDVDTQYDFMRADGKLYVPDAGSIVPVLKDLTDHAHRRGIRIIASADDHVPGHRELSATPDYLTTFPDHCMRGTPGQLKIAETALRDPLVIGPEADPDVAARVLAHRADILFLKHWFDVFTNLNVPAVIETLAPDRIVLYGVATDVCTKYAIEGLRSRYPAIELWCVIDAGRAIHPDQTAELHAAWQAAGVRLTDSTAVLGGMVVAQ
ncbi:MAG: cysteine hydrolase family protein [Gemmatimonadales bacterium]